MRLTDILKPTNIKVPLVATVKTEAIGALVTLLKENGEVTHAKKVLNSVLEREATRTTGIGNGLAIPHGKCAGVDHLVIPIGKPEAPIEFESIDGRPVNLIVLLASPPDQTGPHIQALARISRLMNVEAFKVAMRSATNPQQIFDAVVTQENAM